MTVAALILASGRGQRVGGEIPKQYRKVAGKSVLLRAIECFVENPGIDFVKAVIREEDAELYSAEMQGVDILPPAFGGSERQLSAMNGLESLAKISPEIVLIHDAARPIVELKLIKRVLDGLKENPGVIPALPVSDTLKRVDNNTSLIQGTVNRDVLWRAQTPQGFHFPAILNAYRQLPDELLTDDAAVMERAGLPVVIVQGAETNIKITTEDNFMQASHLLREGSSKFKVGIGYDVHKMTLGNKMVLCGVEIPCEYTLVGHSDADVALHALTDSLLGAVGCGDIGQHFPPSDPKWKGADSKIFVTAAKTEIAMQGGVISNVDITIICEYPKIGPHRELMRENVSNLLSIPISSVNIKATTTEKLGFTGRREGIAAQAISSIELPTES